MCALAGLPQPVAKETACEGGTKYQTSAVRGGGQGIRRKKRLRSKDTLLSSLLERRSITHLSSFRSKRTSDLFENPMGLSRWNYCPLIDAITPPFVPLWKMTGTIRDRSPCGIFPESRRRSFRRHTRGKSSDAFGRPDTRQDAAAAQDIAIACASAAMSERKVGRALNTATFPMGSRDGNPTTLRQRASFRSFPPSPAH
jgi:hypothetical protein